MMLQLVFTIDYSPFTTLLYPSLFFIRSGTTGFVYLLIYSFCIKQGPALIKKGLSKN